MQLGVESAGAVGYLFAVFLYAIAATVILPIPVELLLPLYPGIDPGIKAVVLGLGKAAGAIVVFYVGKKMNPHIERWMGRHDLAAKILKPLEAFVRGTGWIGLTVLLAIPLMSDTADDPARLLLEHDARRRPQGRERADRRDRRRHEVADEHLRWVLAFRGNLPQNVPVREEADRTTVLHDDEPADLLRGHAFRGVGDRAVGIDDDHLTRHDVPHEDQSEPPRGKGRNGLKAYAVAGIASAAVAASEPHGIRWPASPNRMRRRHLGNAEQPRNVHPFGALRRTKRPSPQASHGP